MTIGITKVFKVDLRRLKDWVVATSDSEELRGLYLANPSYDEVAKQIPSAIQLLYKTQHRQDVLVERLNAENDSKKQSNDTMEFVAKVAKHA